MTTEQYFTHTVTLTDSQLNEKARAIATAMAEINRIEEERKKIADLRKTMKELSREIEEGAVTTTRLGKHEWHFPSEGMVYITPVYEDHFEPFTREMTPEEKEEHSQLEINFEEPQTETSPKAKVLHFRSADQEKEWLLANALMPAPEPYNAKLHDRQRFAARRLRRDDRYKPNFFYEGVFETRYDETSSQRIFTKLVEVYKKVSDSLDRANVLNLQEKYATPEPEPKAPTEPKADGAWYSVEQGENNFFPWLIRMEVWKDGRLVENKGVYHAKTLEEANTRLNDVRRAKEALDKAKAMEAVR